MDTRLRTHIDALRTLAKSNDLNQVILVEQNIDEYLKARADHLSYALERLRNSIHEEERANRSGEDWSTARDYVRRLLHKMPLVEKTARINAMNEKTIDQIEEAITKSPTRQWRRLARDEIAGVWTFICTGIQCGQVFALKQ